MRLAFVSVSGQLGGSEGVLLQLIEQIRRLRAHWDVHLVVMSEGPLAGRALALGARVTTVPLPAAVARIGEWGSRGRALRVALQVAGALGEILAYRREVARALDSLQPDILHTNGFKAHAVTARMRTRAVRVWHVHEYVSRRPLTRRLLRLYGGVPEVIVANSLSVANDVTRITAERMRRPVRVIYNGVDLDRFSPHGAVADIDAACGLPPAPEGTIRVGLVATFARWKGHETFLRALARLPEDAPVRGYIIGGAVYDTPGSQWSLDELRAKAREVGADARVGFTGFQSDAPAFLRALDVVVHASTEPEPFGLVIVEAMATGKAVVTSGTGGAEEIVTQGRTALVHRAGDSSSLAEGIERLARDASLRARIGAAGREEVLSRFQGARFGDAFVNLYESMRAHP